MVPNRRAQLSRPVINKPLIAESTVSRRWMARTGRRAARIWRAPLLASLGMTLITPAGAVPVSDLDAYTDAALLNPWPVYRQLRDAGPAVWLPSKCR